MIDHVKSPPTLDDLRARRDEIVALAAKYGASNVRVFGSVARGEATPTSDVDLLVSFEPSASLYSLSGLRQDLHDLLGYSVDVVEDHSGLRERFRGRIAKGVVPL
jgi:predicted nucleotidyltransferase